MFGFPKLNKEKIYKMHLCMIDDEDIALNGDIHGEYYASSAGSFQMHTNFTVINEIYVKKAKKRGYVQEISTGLEMPLVILQITRGLKENRYECCPFGDTSSLAVAFAVQKNFELEKETDQDFVLTEVSAEEMQNYLRDKAKDRTWKPEINQALLYAIGLKKLYLKKEIERLESISEKGLFYYQLKRKQKHTNALQSKNNLLE